MSKKPQSLEQLLQDWPFESGQIQVREFQGDDGRELLHMRVDMGILQMEVSGRPDGLMPEGFETYYDYLVAVSFEEGEGFKLDDQRCTEIDREFYQYYHRRISWLTLKKYEEAIRDARHTLALMDFSSAFSPNDEWSLMHEQYRPFVMFHEIQASSLVKLEANDPEAAVKVIDQGLKDLKSVFDQHDAAEYFDQDNFVVKLTEMREAVKEHYELGPSLAEQLAEAIAREQYELAAKIRDRIAHRGRE